MVSSGGPSEPCLSTEQRQAVLTITLNRPAVLNAFNREMLSELVRILEELTRDQSVRAVLLRGKGRAFCVGDDVKEWDSSDDESEEHVAEWLRQGHHRIVKTLRGLPRPVIAAVQGYAVGFGLDLALACDYRVAAYEAQLGDGRMLRAIPIATGGTYLRPQTIGLPRAVEMLLTGKLIDAREGERIGLVHRAVPGQELESVAWEVTNQMAHGPTKAIGLVKKQVYEEFSMDLASALENELRYRVVRVEDTEEGRTSFLEKRDPVFKGT